MKSIINRFFIAFFISFPGTLYAAHLSDTKNTNHQESWLTESGAVRSGLADGYMTLLDMRRSYSAKLKTERLILDWGDSVAAASLQSGYSQVEYQKQNQRVIISLAQTLNSKIESQQISEKFKNDLYVKSAQLEFDPISQSQNLVLQLRKPMKLRVANYSGQINQQNKTPARLVVDLVE